MLRILQTAFLGMRLQTNAGTKQRIPRHGERLPQINTREMTSYPTTVIIRDKRENPRKCSILPLQGRDDLLFFHHPPEKMPSFEGYVRLAAEGPPLSEADASSGLLLLDASWQRAEKMIRVYKEVPPRSLKGYRTAYPRVSKRGTDPDNGLATVEALFLAYHILGRPTAGLLDHYFWREEFLKFNGLVFR